MGAAQIGKCCRQNGTNRDVDALDADYPATAVSSDDFARQLSLTSAEAQYRCSKGHPLNKHITPHDEFICDGCDKKVGAGTVLFGCRLCDYDTCGACLRGSKAGDSMLQSETPENNVTTEASGLKLEDSPPTQADHELVVGAVDSMVSVEPPTEATAPVMLDTAGAASASEPVKAPPKRKVAAGTKLIATSDVNVYESVDNGGLVGAVRTGQIVEALGPTEETKHGAKMVPLKPNGAVELKGFRFAKKDEKATKGWPPKGKKGADGSDCPGTAMIPKLTPLQKIAKQRKEEDAKADEMRGLVDDILAGKYKKEGGGQPAGDMRIEMPSAYERQNTRRLMLAKFRAEYDKIGRVKAADGGPVVTEHTQGYTTKEQEGLTITGGHQPMPRPKGVQLPKDFRKPLPKGKKEDIGTMKLADLRKFKCDGERLLVSVYGDIFDCSDRPDKYGPDGPYSWMTGSDITWGFVSGKDTPSENNKLYDLWKIAPKEFRDSKQQAIFAWVTFYEFEYGNPIGRLAEYQKEAGLKGPPMEESEECSIM